MGLLQRVFGRKHKFSQAYVVRRTAAVIDNVIFDVGIETLVGGTFMLDNGFRLRFSAVPLVRRRGIIATVQVSAMAEATLLRAICVGAAPDLPIVKAHSACLAHAVVRELGSQSAAFRALPLEL
jgi:nitrogen fixation protein